MIRFGQMSIGQATALGCLALLAGCGGDTRPAPLPPPPPPAPPPKLSIPARPIPPDHASPLLQVPPLLASGLRYSVNREITPAQATWNLRSAYNVAALNCRGPGHVEIVPSYKAFLKVHAKGLAAVNRKVDGEFRDKFGAKFIAPREKYMTEVYNHFASPPTLPAFCDAMVAVSREIKTVKPADLPNYAARSLPAVEIVFDDFYRRYDQYRSDLAAWESRYGALVGTSTSR